MPAHRLRRQIHLGAGRRISSELELLDLRRNRLEHQVPVNLFIDEGAGPTGTLALAHNAFWLEPLGNGSMRGYFMTESDNQAELVIYDAMPWINRE